MTPELISIQDISPYPANAKKHPLNQVKKIANSIQEFGFNQPIVIDNERWEEYTGQTAKLVS